MINAKKKPIRNLSLQDCYELAQIGYIFVKYKDVLIVRKD